MRLLFAAAVSLSGALIAQNALAQTPGHSANDVAQTCYEQARRQGPLQGEALSRFMAQCTAAQTLRTPVSASPAQVCADRARLLSGEEKSAALRACLQ